MISIDYKDRKPIYEQLVDNIKDLVLKGVLACDEQLPSVRQLANDLAINPNTIQKAYTELERQGVTYSLKGRGCFIASGTELLRAELGERLWAALLETVGGLLDLGVPGAEIQRRVMAACQQRESGDSSDQG